MLLERLIEKGECIEMHVRTEILLHAGKDIRGRTSLRAERLQCGLYPQAAVGSAVTIGASAAGVGTPDNF
jgi:hypothetical protein